MSAMESGYTSTEETSPKRSSHKSARPQSLVPPYLINLPPPCTSFSPSLMLIRACRIMAVNFADQLNNIFLLNDTLDELATSVEKKFVIDPCSCNFR